MFNEMTFDATGFIGKTETGTVNGTTKSTIRIGINKSWKTESGEKKERKDWFELVSFSEGIANLVTDAALKPGRYIRARGEIRENRWTDNDGKDHYDVNFIAREIFFCDRKPD
jgi:single-strand DNA-binding protein